MGRGLLVWIGTPFQCVPARGPCHKNTHIHSVVLNTAFVLCPFLSISISLDSSIFLYVSNTRTHQRAPCDTPYSHTRYNLPSFLILYPSGEIV